MIKPTLTLLLALSLEAKIDLDCVLCYNYTKHMIECKVKYDREIKDKNSIKAKTYEYYKKLSDKHCRCKSEEGK